MSLDMMFPSLFEIKRIITIIIMIVIMMIIAIEIEVGELCVTREASKD